MLVVTTLFDLVPISYAILKVLCIGYLFYLALKIATNTSPIGETQANNKPFSFIQAALFQ